MQSIANECGRAVCCDDCSERYTRVKLMNPTDLLGGSALFEHGNIALTVLNYHQGFALQISSNLDLKGSSPYTHRPRAWASGQKILTVRLPSDHQPPYPTGS